MISFFSLEGAFFKYFFKIVVFHIMSWIIVILECTKSTKNPLINFLHISVLHEEITWPVWASRIREQSMWCKSEVLNKYGQNHISINCFIHVREILPLPKNTIFTMIEVLLKKKNSLLSPLGWLRRIWQGFAPKVIRRQKWLVNVGCGSKTKSVNDICLEKL